MSVDREDRGRETVLQSRDVSGGSLASWQRSQGTTFTRDPKTGPAGAALGRHHGHVEEPRLHEVFVLPSLNLA